MTRFIAVTQRVEIIADRNERRDALDRRWTRLLGACGFGTLPLPNDVDASRALVASLEPAGAIFTGGNDLVAVGGDAAERDAVESMLLDWAVGGRRPLLAVCRGLQFLAHRFGAAIEPAEGHVGEAHWVRHSDGRKARVNSYHDWAFRIAPPEFEVTATAEDGTVEGLRHCDLPIRGIMWHPERNDPFEKADMALIGEVFGGEAFGDGVCAR